MWDTELVEAGATIWLHISPEMRAYTSSELYRVRAVQSDGVP